MANVWFMSDPHIGHTNIHKFREFVASEQDNRAWIQGWWDRIVTKRDTVYVLGDAAFTDESVDWFKGLSGRKFLIRGNHDTRPTTKYLEAFSEVYGIHRYKGMWLSHAPIHPDELRGKVNLHGHVHYQTVLKDGAIDPRYVNCCVENLRELFGRPLMSLSEVRTLLSSRGVL